MSAFDDYCIVCEKLCTGASAYCSEECKLQDTHTHFTINNAPQLISPMLQPRQDSIVSTLQQSTDQSDEEEEEEIKQQEYLIKSPMLLSSTLKNENSIAGLDLDDCVPRETGKELDQHHTDLLAASSNYYRKWLNVKQ
ncbi:CYFA0S15e00188g1_1 [Cyberlindnera fabianii]|uniref:CYFA0S15e00188g1_1 n=1 Tax=Cyberlindnera fabianii TaxID=36022 RepID=A0A061B529_CYBFA|nr:hypothetical protein BON22_3358 [Cyberlindnera fabianii]CDR44573.1 CYFA0S15e00188g1_1 [Cyberlindnera fabianii]